MTDDVDGLGKIFIAGTGRSGTTILLRILGDHPDAYPVPEESKFIPEGDGLHALIPRLCGDYSLLASAKAFKRFIEMMGAKWNGGEWQIDLWTAGEPLGERLGAESTQRALSNYLEALKLYRFGGIFVPRHFKERRELIALTRRFVADLFGVPALMRQKGFWVEKTPGNLSAMDLIWEIFPEAAIIHIKRDPRGVLHSALCQPWMSNDVRELAGWLAHTYSRWGRDKARLDLANRRYVELKLEDFARDPATHIAEIERMTGIRPGLCDLSELNIEFVDRWITSMSVEHRRYCEERLGEYFELMDYDL